MPGKYNLLFGQSFFLKAEIMEKSSLNQVQQAIVKALEDLGEKSKYTEYILAKKIRENEKISGKQKAGIAMTDLDKAIEYFESNGLAFYALQLNSANDILIQKAEASKPLTLEARQRRNKSEKSMSILTNGDFSAKNKASKPKKKVRTERTSLSVRDDYENY